MRAPTHIYTDALAVFLGDLRGHIFSVEFIGAVLGALLGAFFGFLGAYLLMLKERKYEQRMDADRIAQGHRIRFLHILDLLRKCHKAWSRAHRQYLTLADQYEKEWFKVFEHPVQIDVARITLSNMPREDIRLSYISVMDGTVGRAAYYRTIAMVDYFTAKSTHMLRGIEAFKDDINTHGQRMNELQIELGLTMTHKWRSMIDSGRREDPLCKELQRILEQIHPYLTYDNRPSAKVILDEFVTPSLRLAGGNYDLEEITEILRAAKRAQVKIVGMMDNAAQLVVFCREHAKRMEKYTRKTGRLIQVLERYVH